MKPMIECDNNGGTTISKSQMCGTIRRGRWQSPRFFCISTRCTLHNSHIVRKNLTLKDGVTTSHHYALCIMHYALIFFSILLTSFIRLSAVSPLLLDICLLETTRAIITTPNQTFAITSGNAKTTISALELIITSTNNALTINNKRYARTVTITSPTSLSLNNISYEGTIKITALNRNLLRVINTIDLESYVNGVVPAEIGGQAPLEAQKAQAIATRSITICKVRSHKHTQDGYDLCNTTHCQVYKGLTEQTDISIKAVKDTENQIMLYNGSPVEAFYSSHCGGITEFSGNLWAFSHEYLVSVVDSYCIDYSQVPAWSQKNITWEKVFTRPELATKLGLRNISEMYITRRNSSTRITEVFIRSTSKNITLSGQYDIRNTLDLPSSLFFIFDEGHQYRFTGNGYGHGVGMCQTGAIARAMAGFTCEEILSFYYNGVVISGEW